MSVEGKVVSIALRSGKQGPMEVVSEVEATVDGGIEPNREVKADRGITFIAQEQWGDVVQELNAPDLPWHTRRANVLTSGLVMGDLIGKTIQLGDVVVEIKKETRGCGVMDRLYEGLRDALAPDFRAGVHGRVVQGGRFVVGDTITVQEG